MSARDELAEIIWDEDAGDWRQSGPNDVADAILAAGYSKPRTITTIGGLSAEPAGTVILTAHGRTFEYTSRNWLCPGFPNDYQPIIDWLPATVLYEPKSA